MSMSRPGAKGVDGPVLLGTPTPVLSGTQVPYYWERERLVTLWRGKADSLPSNFPNSESFGLLLTRSANLRVCGRLDVHAEGDGATNHLRPSEIAS